MQDLALAVDRKRLSWAVEAIVMMMPLTSVEVATVAVKVATSSMQCLKSQQQ
jgi:hypothetical protein